METHSCGPEYSQDHSCFLNVLTGTRALSWDYSHNLVMELLEQCSLGGLGHKIGDHIAGWAPLNGELLLLYPICDKVVTDIDVLRALAAQDFVIVFQEYGTPVVLVNNIFSDFASLCLHKVSRPAYGWHTVIHSN
jgi:hypothetical protein